MKTTKKRLEVFSFYDHAGISRHLEKMAAKGWMIESMSNFGWVYHRIEPQTFKFAVSYYPKASEFDPEPTDEQKTFHEFCAHTGWKLACTSAQLQIFYNEQENPTPIETEPTLEIQSIHGSAKKSFIPSYLLLLLISIMGGGLFVSGMLGDPTAQLASPTKLFTGLCYLILFALCIAELACYFHWHSKAKKLAEQGEFLSPASTSKIQKVILGALFIGFIYWGINFIFTGDKMRRWVGIEMCFYAPSLMLIVNTTKNALKKRKVSRGVNRTITLLVDFVLAFAMMGLITFGTLKLANTGFFAEDTEDTYEHGGMTWIVYNDELPLTVEDLTGESYEGYIKERRGDESFLLGQFELYQRPRFDTENYKEMPQLEYKIVFVKVPALYDLCKNQLLDKKDETDNTNIPEGFKRVYLVQDPVPWKANEVYQLAYQDTGALNEYLLCYDDRIIEINFDWEPTAEQMAIVAEKLNGN